MENVDKQFYKNAILSAFNVLVSSAVLFFTYRYLLDILGPDRVGVWAVVIASASSAKISEFGLAASAVKYVAKYAADGNTKKAAQIVDTTSLTVSVLVIIFLALSYPIIEMLLNYFMPLSAAKEALELLPYVVASILISSIAGAYVSGLEGISRMDIRIYASMFSTIIFALLTWLLVPAHGLIGVAIAQIVQGLLILCITATFLRRKLPISLYGWKLNSLKEMINYGVKFQVIMIFYMLAEPATKIIMAKFGGLSNTAYYEMASRLVGQCRLLLVSANQAIIPKIAGLREGSNREIKKLYSINYKIMWSLSLPMFFGISILAPSISYFWIGIDEPEFIKYILLICLCQVLNALTVPSYFFSLGTGDMKWNTMGHIIFGMLNVALCYVLGYYYNGNGVVVGYALSLIIGSSVIIGGFHYCNNISILKIHQLTEVKILIVCIVALFFSYISSHWFFGVIDEFVKTFCFLLIMAAPFLNKLIRSSVLKLILNSKNEYK